MYGRSQWGEYRVLDSGRYPGGNMSLTKELVIEAGKQLSYRRYEHVNEVWTVVSGEGEAVLDGEVVPVSAGSVVNAPAGIAHACRGISDLRIIEVQQGDSLTGEDVECLGNFWVLDGVPDSSFVGTEL